MLQHTVLMSDSKNAEIFEGTLRLRGKRGGFVVDEQNNREISIDRDGLNTALQEDIVNVAVSKKGSEYVGKVTEVVSRARTDFVGTLEKDGDEYHLKPQDPRVYTKFSIPEKDIDGAKDGEKVLVTLVSWDDPKQEPIGKVSAVIGVAGLHETEIQAIVLDKGLTIGFSKEILDEAQKIKDNYPALLKQEEQTRKDFRGVTTFTIDPEDAKDFDDALSIQKLSDGNIEVGIHIADPTFFISQGSIIDKNAKEKSTSIYLVDRTIPMLPEVLSNDLCSLNPNEDKLTFSAVMTLTPEGKVVDRWFGRTIIHSDKRFTYKDAQNSIDSGASEFSEELTLLNTIAKKIRVGRVAGGAIEFEHDEVYFQLDDKGTPISIYRKEPLETHKLIEEFMILANKEVAFFMSKNDKNAEKVFVYRVHGLPSEEKILELVNLMRALGYDMPKKTQGFTMKDISMILEVAKDTPHEDLVQMATIRAMAKAIYTTKNIGHFGLSIDYYTHFTSPIRRYPDMMVHRLLAHCLNNKPIPAKELAVYESASQHASAMEILASKAQRESIKYKQTEYMASKIGQIFEGAITGLSEYGIYVRENESLAEGMVSLRDLRDDYYTLDQKTFSIIGKDKGKKYSLGDNVKIKVTNANIEKKLIDYQLVK